MEYLIPSFLAGLLTILAPCVIALLPVILGGSLGQKDPWRPLIVAGSLGVSVVAFTLLLKATTVLINVPQSFWAGFSGVLIVLVGLTMLFPSVWSTLSYKMKFHKSEGLLEKGRERGGKWGAVILGAALGPVFTSCSPTYFLILGVVLPNNLFVGILNLLAYTLGLVLLLLLIGYGGQGLTRRFRFAVNPNGWFKKALGILLILTGLMVVTGFDKTFEAWVLKSGYQGPIQIEQNLLPDVE